MNYQSTFARRLVVASAKFVEVTKKILQKVSCVPAWCRGLASHSRLDSTRNLSIKTNAPKFTGSSPTSAPLCWSALERDRQGNRQTLGTRAWKKWKIQGGFREEKFGSMNDKSQRKILWKKKSERFWDYDFSKQTKLLSRVGSLIFVVNMRKLRRLIYLSLLGILGTFVVLLLPAYVLLAMFGALALLFVAQQLNFYKIVMMLKRFIQNTRRLYFENRLKLRTGFRGYRDTDIENSSRRCRWAVHGFRVKNAS